MVKFGKNKMKALKKLSKRFKQPTTENVTNKVLKKKINAEKKVTFQKEILLKEAATKGSALVNKISVKHIIANELTGKKSLKKTSKDESIVQKTKLKPVEKRKKRHKTRVNDKKLLLKLMNEKKSKNVI